MKKVSSVFFLLFIYLTLHAQQDSLKIKIDSLYQYYDMSLEELSHVKASGVSSELETFINSLITVASQKAISTRESPSAISLISEEDIKKSGARDLIDVLRLVPGFDFAYDGSNTIGIGIRGNWANEGKVLLQVDGVQMNEIFSGATQFGNNFPIASISRIEIIRGPGSAIYGGFAELGVINIITKNPDELNGGYITGTFGQMQHGSARRTLNLGIGKKVKAFEFSLTGVMGEGNRSDRTAFVRGVSTTISSRETMANNSATNPFFWNGKIGYKGFSLRLIYDNYKTDVLTLTDESGKRFLSRYTNALSAEAKYTWKASDKLSLTPSLFLTWQSPGVSNLSDSLNLIQDRGHRFQSSVTAAYDFSRKINMVTGATYFTDIGTNDADSITTISNYVSSIQYHTYALFSQLTIKHRIANIVLGARYENNSEFGDAFVPRIAFTKRVDRFHLKLLYSNSFRSPSIQNIARGVANTSGAIGSIGPEHTRVAEIELGYQLTRDILTTANFFNTSIKDPIVYISDLNLYTNFDKSGSQGVELEARMKKRWGSITANYSFYTVANQTRLQIYSTQQYIQGDTLQPSGGDASKSTLLAFPAHKITLTANVTLSKSLSISSSILWNSKRYGYDFQTSDQGTYEIYLKEDAPKLMSNIFLTWSSPVKGLDLGAGVFNLFNTRYNYMVPVGSRTAAPLPSGSREYTIRLSFLLKSKTPQS
ncbi:TonB-dependent receptor plug domain-containing protein [Ohtaekwangia koreensis]|uniref:Outer membrane cobalamin receptor protein n=1 Tax=Ohtaekwangia koreensis TaxID=688867 RepID=A0A1T5M0D1_9BACT|nr:TonB-dependent receptor plug domain-containing protein [Ohtaekwangia koreensis]SKC81575.1 Outer membrane cobalamin receptor protein [Ohtaekwangia koreensis]